LDVTHACPGCGWRGFRTRVENAVVADLDALLEGEGVASLAELADQLGEHTGLSVQLHVPDPAEGAGVELLIGCRGILSPFPISRADLWADVEFLADVARLHEQEMLSEDDPAEADDPAEDDESELSGPEEHPRLPAELLTLLQLDPHGTGLEPSLVAKVCGWDRDCIVGLIEIGERDVIAWREAAREAAAAGDAEEAEACSHEAAGWQRTVDDLRGGLRAVVDRPQRRRR
jgi:hypothetical protein